ncbi:uracil phosphoribosyltransferase [Desulfofalx alkaliphila]|uniref:uracil phosphoribosyltransferase n=1 Tax=Desulfofalx alkaliphila TaxID=105483 RepID=UPI0004E16126|nr:uracil phosphoribosyltransferase [Desulfofalx alkaliphila]
MDNVVVVEHPVTKHCLKFLRDKKTGTALFRDCMSRLGLCLAYQATADLPTRQAQVETPLNVMADVEELDMKGVLLIPVLRAGLGFVNSFLEIIPEAKIAHIGMARDHQTLEAKVYLRSLPDKLDTYQRVYVLDPMLATGNSCVKTMDILTASGIDPASIVLVCAFTAPEGIKQLHQKYPQIKVVTASVDKCLNEVGYIIPGCGDAGDRLFLL